MKVSKEASAARFRLPEKGHDFVVEDDGFEDLQINSTPEIENFFYFYNTQRQRLIKQFVLKKGPITDTLCQVTLIKKNDKFTPRLTLSIRDKSKKIQSEAAGAPTNVRASVSLEDCHENFWKLLSFLQTVRSIEIPLDSFSLISQEDSAIVAGLRGRKRDSIKRIIQQLSLREDINLSERDVYQLLKRRDRLWQFKAGLDRKESDESKWQKFLEQNKWIFGYGLNYQILRQELTQPNYGGARVDGQGGQRGDFLASTMGSKNFTVLVEIKTPATLLLQGTKEIRNGAWSFSRDLMDSLSQIQANIATWELDGSRQVENRDLLEGRDVYTVHPKGIIVIGSLEQLHARTKHNTFQRLRASIHGVEIITFDELYCRAEFIVDSAD